MDKDIKKKKNASGRPVGTTKDKISPATLKKKIRDYLKEKDVKELIKIAHEQAKAGDKKMLQFLLDHSFGKPRQNVGLDGGKDGQPIMTMSAMLDQLEGTKKLSKGKDGVFK